MKIFLLFIISLFISVGYGQNKKDSFLLEKKGLNPMEFFSDLKTGNVLLDMDRYSDLKSISNYGINKIISQSFQSNSRFLSKQEKYSLRLDSFVDVEFYQGDLYGKTESTYDENGHQTLYIQHLWDKSTRFFVPNRKYEYIYDLDGNQTLYTGYYWNSSIQSFVFSTKEESTFDVNGHPTLHISYIWDTTNQSFRTWYKSEVAYDINGNRTLDIFYIWDTTTQSFVPSVKNEYNYDIKVNRTLTFQYTWSNTNQSFVPSYKYESTYDGYGKIILRVVYIWDTPTQSFVIYNKDGYTRDVYGNITLCIQYLWNTTTQSLVPSYKNESTYDVNGNQTLSIQFSWSTTTQSFVPSSKTEYTFDVNGYLTLETNYKWYTGLGVYKPSFKQEYSIILENEIKLVRKGTVFKYDTNFNSWNELVGEEYKSYWYYTKTASLSTEEFKSNPFLLYPNPTSDYINIKTTEQLSNPQVEMFDMSGKRVLSQPIKSSESIDIRNLTPSTYLYHIKDGKSLLKSGKIIKE